MRLTQNFRLIEFTRSWEAEARGINNTPNDEQIENLKTLAGVLEQVRALLGGRKIYISSGFRISELNAAIGGSEAGDHPNGLAADFKVHGMDDLEVCRRIRDSDIQYDQLIFEQGKRSTWVHLGIGDRMRRMELSWKSGKGYISGLSRM